MRLALLSDIHGNTIALDAVLADIAATGGVDAHWVLGDHAAVGPDPVGSIERLIALPNTRFVRGNTDRYTVTSDRPVPTPEEVLGNPALLPTLILIEAGFSWTRGAVTAAGQFDWLATLPLEQRLILPDGTRLLGVHAAPGADDGLGIHPDLTDDELGALLAGCDADLVVVGHTHVPLDRTIDGTRVVNLGSVSNPVTADLRAGYALLDADTLGHRLERRNVTYDLAAAVAALERSRYPGATYVSAFLRGERRSRWA